MIEGTAGGAGANMKTDSIETWYPESRFGGFTDIDGTILFYARLRSLLSPESVVLDAGCGRAVHSNDPVLFRRDLRNLKGSVARLIGIDVDPAAVRNPWVDEFSQIESDGSFPVVDSSCDLVFSDSVLEHVEDPGRFLRESARVLKPGGVLAIRTTNSLGYVAVGARLIPRSRHIRFLSRAQSERNPEDMFPPVYVCNTRRKLRRALERAGFDAVVYTTESEPRYFRFSRLLYALAVFHQRFAPRAVRLALVAFARKRP